MGFSISGAAAIIFVSGFIAFGMWATASANSLERVAEAESDRSDAVLEQQNTAIAITSAEYNGSHVTLTADNVGANTVHLTSTDLLIDGTFESGWEDRATVGPSDDAGTDLWKSGETLDITVSHDEEPSRVKLVTETSVSDTSGVTNV